MDKAILVVHVLVAVSLVILILVQRSTADGGAAFGGGSQQSLLGTSGSAPLLTKVTVGLVVIFFVTSLSLAYINRHFGSNETIIIPEAETVEAIDAIQDDLQNTPEVTINPVDDDIPVVPELDSETGLSDSDIPVPAQ